MLKYTSKSISKPLTNLFNLSLEQRVNPSFRKTASVMPLLKKGDKWDVSNYRPISLICCVEKSFERIVNIPITTLCQFPIIWISVWVLPDHSTGHHLIELIHHTYLALEKYVTICHVFCDIPKGFDSVWHRGLIHKLKKYGISGDLLEWIQNNLHMRNQRIFVNSTFSSLKSILAGVPQGLVLGPLLFLSYINDIADYRL